MNGQVTSASVETEDGSGCSVWAGRGWSMVRAKCHDCCQRMVESIVSHPAVRHCWATGGASYVHSKKGEGVGALDWELECFPTGEVSICRWFEVWLLTECGLNYTILSLFIFDRRNKKLCRWDVCTNIPLKRLYLEKETHEKMKKNLLMSDRETITEVSPWSFVFQCELFIRWHFRVSLADYIGGCFMLIKQKSAVYKYLCQIYFSSSSPQSCIITFDF